MFRRRDKWAVFEFDDTSIRVTFDCDSTDTLMLNAAEIMLVEVYKTDHVTIDSIWVKVTMAGGETISLNEEQKPYYNELWAWLGRNNLIQEPDWFEKSHIPLLNRV